MFIAIKMIVTAFVFNLSSLLETQLVAELGSKQGRESSAASKSNCTRLNKYKWSLWRYVIQVMKVKKLYWVLTIFHKEVVGPIAEKNGKEWHNWAALEKDFTFGSIK